jgi:hypothetical protein
MAKKKLILSIPPFWAGVILLFPAFLIFVILALLGIEARNRLNPREGAIVTLLFMIALLTRYDICEDQLIVKLIILPIKRISWDKISGAVYIPKHLDGKEFKRGASIMLTLYPCKTFDRNKNNIALFKWLHPLNAIRLYIPEGQEEVCLRTFEVCIGSGKCQQFPRRTGDGSCVLSQKVAEPSDNATD